MSIKPTKLEQLPETTIETILSSSGELPYEREPKYLSPSSFFELEGNPDLFYLKRMGPEEYVPPRQPQANYFGVGSAFDFFIKALIAQRIGQLLPTNMYEDQVESHNRRSKSMVPRLGMAGAAAYFDSPCWERLFTHDKLHKIEDQVDIRRINGIPIWGKPDASFWTSEFGIGPFDFKTTGAFANYKKAPAPGYDKYWVWEEGVWREKGPHKSAANPLEVVNEKWAIQCVFYGWLLGREPTLPMPAGIDQVVYNGGNISIAQYRKVVGVEFQQAVLERLEDAWNKVRGKRVTNGPDATWTMLMA